MTVYDDIQDERRRQDVQWGEQNHPDIVETGGLHLIHGSSLRLNCQRAFDKGNGSWAHILSEEVGEALDEARVGDTAALEIELIQVAAVAVQWVEALRRRSNPEPAP